MRPKGYVAFGSAMQRRPNAVPMPPCCRPHLVGATSNAHAIPETPVAMLTLAADEGIPVFEGILFSTIPRRLL